MARRSTTGNPAGANRKQTGARRTMGDSAEMRAKTSTAARKTARAARASGKKR